MSKIHRLLTMLAVVLVTAGTMAAVLVGGGGPGAVAAATDQVAAAKYVSSAEVAPGQRISYTITLTNTSGASLDNLSIADSLDPSLSYVMTSFVVDRGILFRFQRGRSVGHSAGRGEPGGARSVRAHALQRAKSLAW